MIENSLMKPIKRTIEVRVRISITSVHRERLAREMVNPEDIREWRDGIKEAIRLLTERIDRAFQQRPL